MIVEIAILGTESLGVRGMSCTVQTEDRFFVIDPGVALGWQRHGLLPHPFQVGRGNQVRKEICRALTRATDIVISHYHGDHIPLADANPYQLAVDRVSIPPDVRLWCKGEDGISNLSLKRREMVEQALSRPLGNAEGSTDGIITCSRSVSHGGPHSRLGQVMMTCIREHDGVFVHTSDIQLLNREAVDTVLAWEPSVVFASGPPLYLSSIGKEERDLARSLALELAANVRVLIIDHHLLRSIEGFRWLSSLAAESKCKIQCAAEFMGRPPLLLEAWRTQLYERMPVPPRWHSAYARGKTGFEQYMACDLDDLQEGMGANRYI